ncbi:hypothetical protein SPF06_14225 [Sinomonas sp. JGH33]|uniref:Secreted protein n=1 Tax=Sinomonas terricola TaxID=3110330 RepID=A0ABU5T896_9MICC|nr:hypothetical protein [Sinomonas sp. JGH33]MEA5455887.1 hypothetical protein [Sinomonas sp. JGH33]
MDAAGAATAAVAAAAVATPVAAKAAPSTAAAARFVLVFMVLRSGARGTCQNERVL